MCGIVGFLDWRQSIDEPGNLIDKMGDAISYRGPDDSGKYIDRPIALGHRRLAIIDLVAGQQPMTDVSGRYTIIFNGEIYNYPQLKRLLARHYEFRTDSDTEVLLYHFIRFGIDGLKQINGMFAFAVWDKHRQTLYLARDRFGKKPLYFFQSKQAFVFGSELKSLLLHPSIERQINHSALVQYLQYEYLPSTQTPFKNIHKVPPGSCLTVALSGISEKKWWKLLPYPDDFHKPVRDYRHQFDEILGKAVADRMVADVPVGVLLSGGIDSSTIAWYMKQHTNYLHSFSVSFDDRSFDESRYASLAASRLGTVHHNVAFSLAEFERMLHLAQDRLDEPLGDASLLPTMLVSELAKKHVTVVLDGDGADELLYGYNTFAAWRYAKNLPTIPPQWQSILSGMAKKLPTRHGYFSWDFKLKSFIGGLSHAGLIRNQVWLGSFNSQDLPPLLTKAWQEYTADIYQSTTALETQYRSVPYPEKLSLIYLSQYLPDDILQKIDRATMYFSLEARTPFLDPRVVSFLLKLPLKYKFRGGRGKIILKETMRGRLPDEIIKRTKKGFGIPLGVWLKGPLKPLLLHSLSREKINNAGIVNYEPVSALVSEHISGKADHRKKLWTLMMLHWWWQRWV